MNTVMICGARRAGTTLMNAVLCTDPRANAPVAETQALTRVVEAYDWTVAEFETFGAPLVGSRQVLDQLYRGWIAEFLDTIAGRLDHRGLVVLKHPALVRVFRSWQTLAPDVRCVVLVRDPRDQIASELEVAKRGGRRPPLIETLARTLSDWFAHFQPNDAVVVRYEDLVQDFPSVRDRLQQSLGVSLVFDPEQPWPNTDGWNRTRSFPSWSPKMGQPVDPGGVGRYERDLTADQVAVVNEICVDYMARFGYRA